MQQSYAASQLAVTRWLPPGQWSRTTSLLTHLWQEYRQSSCTGSANVGAASTEICGVPMTDRPTHNSGKGPRELVQALYVSHRLRGGVHAEAVSAALSSARSGQAFFLVARQEVVA